MLKTCMPKNVSTQGGLRNMSTTSRVAGAVAAGYVLGRFKKLRMAVLVASAMSSPKFRNAAAEMIQSRIPGGAIVGGLTREVGGKLVGVGKTAATSIVASRIDALSQNLAERSENLRKGSPDGKAPKPGAEESAEDRGAEAPEDEYDEEAEQPEDEYEEQEDEEAEQPEDEYEEQEDEEAEQPEDQDAQADDTSGDEEPEEPVARSPRRRRSASPAGRRRG
jgi:flagellar biosynthesis GTPase FlhF